MQVVPQVPSLKEWLAKIRLESLLAKFFESGYDDLETLYFLSYSSLNPLNDDILQVHVGIEKVGHRTIILSKLREEAFPYIETIFANYNVSSRMTDSDACVDAASCKQCTIF